MQCSDWHFTDRKPTVFQAEKPEELFGVYANLIAAALTPGEQLRHLLYALIWEGSEAPFGIRGQPASQAIVLTDIRYNATVRHHFAVTVREYRTLMGARPSLTSRRLASSFLTSSVFRCPSSHTHRVSDTRSYDRSSEYLPLLFCSHWSIPFLPECTHARYQPVSAG